MNLKLSDIDNILWGDSQVKLSDDDLKAVDDCHKFLINFMNDKVIYGINTGFGPMAQYRVPDADLTALQYNIVRSHSTGAGQPMDPTAVRAAMISRLMTFLQFRSGISPDVPRLLAEFINRQIIPFVPQHGSVGASGDLVQLAHMTLTLIGEGTVLHYGEWKPTAEALKAEGLQPLKLVGRDGLSLVNGTAMMTGLGIVNQHYAQRFLEWLLVASVMVNEVAESYDDLMSQQLNEARRQRGQQIIAAKMRNLSSGTSLLRSREVELYGGNNEEHFSHKVQPYYSLRCVPQILGPVLDTLHYAQEVIEREVNSADDNPIVDPETRSIYHGGNFHGDYISLEMDKLKIVITKSVMLAERQLNYLLHDKINEMLPPFCNLGRLGLDYGMQACQFTATSTTAECQTLSNPMYVHSIPNNNDNQDVVSMGTNSALLCQRVLDNAFQVLSIHLMTIAQAVDCRGIYSRLSSKSQEVYNLIRTVFPIFKDDHPHYAEIAAVESILRSVKITDLSRSECQ